MTSGNVEYSFFWFIENYGHCGGYFYSPAFTFQGLGGSSWSVQLYATILKYKDSPCSVCLFRSADDAGPVNLSLKLEISLITADGSTLYLEECKHTFKKESYKQFKANVNMDELFVRRDTEFPPRDTLGLRCRMWRGEGSVKRVEQCTARTRIGIEKFSFIHRVENFSALKIYEERIVQIPSHTKKGLVFSSSLSLCNTSGGKHRVIVLIRRTPGFRDNVIKTKRFSLLDATGNTIGEGEVDFRFHDFEMDREKLESLLTRQFLLKNRGKYLPNDELSLLCEFTFFTGVEHTKMEENLYEIPKVAWNHRYLKAIEKNDCHTIKKVSTCPSVQDDLKTLYNDQLFSDVMLRTRTKSFTAHKNVLSARSSVFRAMLTKDMREKNTDCIRVDDLDDETVERLLLFLYSDHLEGLHWDSAHKLYYAGDKYAIEKLKVLCSSFLVDNIITSNAVELLLLADTHSDAGLKQSVEDFILDHEKEVFYSEEWDKLSETNPQLVIKTMKLKYKREK